MTEVLNWYAANPLLGTVLAVIAMWTLCGVADGLGNIGRRRS